jgi:two-component system, OmpR family, response regulator
MRLLVVEDQLRMARLLRRGLEEEGYSVELAHDGPEAIWAATEADFDAIVLDVMLPGCDGFEVCRRLREAGRWAPVLMLTARDAVPDRIAGLDSGADDYLVKPFSFGELSARLRALLRRGGSPRPAQLEIGPLRLDPARHWVSVAGSPVELTPREFGLLELLMRHPDEVLTRTRILEAVWDFAWEGRSNVVDQYIGYLRRKLEERGAPTLIETVRGIGYRLRAPAG